MVEPMTLTQTIFESIGDYSIKLFLIFIVFLIILLLLGIRERDAIELAVALTLVTLILICSVARLLS